MPKKIICLLISVLLSFSVFMTAYAEESKALRDVCETEETFKMIEAMTESDELKLCIHLKEPTSEIGYISCAELGLSAEEFEQIKIDRYKMNDLVCETFIKDYSLEKAMICRPMPIIECNLTLDDINRMMNDERLKGFVYYKSEETGIDYVNNAIMSVSGEVALEINRLIDGYELYVAYSPWKDEDTVLRSYPIISSSVIDHIPNGTVLEITEFSNGFGKTTYNGKIGWIISGYLQRYEAAADTDESHVVPELPNGEGLVLRDGPGHIFNAAAGIPSGTLLHITETANGYGKTVYNGHEGWVVMDILRNPEAYNFAAVNHDPYDDTDESWDCESWDCEIIADFQMIAGDANNDGGLDMLDVTVTQKTIARLTTDCNKILADIDENGEVDLQDVVKMQKVIANII